MEKLDTIRTTLIDHGLKATLQRIVIYNTMLDIGSHPTAEDIIEHLRHSYPGISSGTVYKTLETFVQKNLIKRVKTDQDSMRYDAIYKHHHHLYCAESDRIEDYFDENLNKMLDDYFKKKKIPDFEIENIKLQIIGKFDHKEKKH